MEIAVGNKVKFINENLEGEVIAIISPKIVKVSCSDGFDYEVAINDILIVGEDNEHLYTVDETIVNAKIVDRKEEKQAKSILNKYTTANKYKYEALLEIDLHLEELVEFPERLDDWQRLHTQMQHAKNCLNAAMNKNIRRIVFIHGKGTGVLKTELINYLSGIDNVSYKEADYREYGAGATEVIIKNS